MFERSFSFAGIPLLAVSQDGRPRPTVLFYHGLHTDKDTHRRELESLAQRGFLALGVDAAGHGGRRMPDLSGFVNRGPLLQQVAKLLRPTLAEVPLLLDFLEAEGYGPFGICGISFGGLLSYAAAHYDARLGSVVAILADPSWCHPYEHVAAYERVRLFAWNGGADQHVSAEPARHFVAHLQSTFPAGHYDYRVYPESDHFMRPEDWEDGWSRTLSWFEAGLL
ncbi:alpha/beta fold hydrolase [bacterium]|nr:alpha/beta fold hydrolase [bacterium]